MTAGPRAAAGVTALVVAAGLAGCGGSAAPAAPPNPPHTYTTSLSALAQKADLIAQDDCTSKPPAQVYPNCARYVAEVGNLALASQSTGVAVAPRLADEVGQFSRAGCVAAPGVAAPAAATCGGILGKIQADLRTLRSQLTAKAASSGASPSPQPAPG